jgi:hypothetical protein
MKIVSLFVFAIALAGSWKLAYSARPVSESVHIGIQEDLKRIIGEYIQKKLPNAEKIKFDKFWTETVKKNKVRAYFSYSFEDKTETSGNVKTEIEGFATLNKLSENDQEITWSFDDIQIKDNHVEFLNPIKIKAGAEGEDAVVERPAEPAPEHSTGESTEH